jgi:regulatory protein YycH of two-component signal transduction system YycFG
VELIEQIINPGSYPQWFTSEMVNLFSNILGGVITLYVMIENTPNISTYPDFMSFLTSVQQVFTRIDIFCDYLQESFSFIDSDVQNYQENLYNSLKNHTNRLLDYLRFVQNSRVFHGNELSDTELERLNDVIRAGERCLYAINDNLNY